MSIALKLALIFALVQDKPEVVSLLGTVFFPQPDKKGAIAAAEAKLAADPKNVDALLALGKAQADLWRYHDAIATYSRAIEMAPDNPLLYRHRGHRCISTRQFARAVEDLERAARLDTASFDIWYHLGLAYYLQGKFDRAISAYERCLGVVEESARAGKSQTDDSLVAVADWLYMAYRRARREQQAARLLERITPDLNVKENTAYFNRLLLYKGLKTEDQLLAAAEDNDLQIATLGYGIGNWHLYSDRKEKALAIFRRIVSGKHWPAFGFIAAEVELAKLK